MRRWGRWLAIALCAWSLTVGSGVATRANDVENARDDANAAIVAGLQDYRQQTAAAYRSAIAHWQTAILRLEELGDRVTATSIALNIGEAQRQLDNLDGALATYEAALPLTEATGDDRTRAQILTELAEVRALRSEFQTALGLYDRALALWETLDYRTGKAETLNALGFVQSELGEFTAAAQTFEAALNLTETLGVPRNLAVVLNNLAGAYLDLQELSRAEAAYERAIAIWQELGDRAGEAATRNNLGDLYRRRGDRDRALQAFEGALGLWGTEGNARARASTLTNLGDLYREMGEPERALEFYDRALPLRQRGRDLPGTAQTRFGRARAVRQQGRLAEAQVEMEAVLEVAEDLRTRVASDVRRARFFETQQPYYEFFIDLLLERDREQPNAGFDGAALEIKERASARSLLDLLGAMGGEVYRGLDPELRDRREALRQRLHVLETQRLRVFEAEPTAEAAAELDRAFDRAIADYRTLEADIRTSSPKYAALTQPKPLGLDAIQTLLDDETTLLAYSLGETGSVLWVVTHDDLDTYALPPRDAIESLANDYLRMVYVPRYRTRRRQIAAATEALSAAILPIDRDRLLGTRLAVMGDGALRYVPFAALGKAGEPPLVEAFEVVNLPSASAVAALRRGDRTATPAEKTLAVFADPVFGLDDERLPNFVAQPDVSPELQRSAQQLDVLFSRLSFTQEEAAEITQLVPGDEALQVSGFEASRDRVMGDRLQDYRIVHFATHGLANSVTPELSGLVLSLFDEQGEPQNGFLRLYDVFNLQLSAELVVLSACNTGRGEDMRGEGIVGLSRGFMYAGVDRLVVSFWSVDDEGTAVLMQRFYRQMLGNGLSPSAALRAAQQELMASDRWNLPYYWAAFAVQGDWAMGDR